MEFNEAKEKLKDGYLESGFEIVDEHPHELFLKYRNQNCRIYKEDIEEYASHEQFISSLEVDPVECGICGPNYREQMLQNLDRRSFYWWIRNGNYVFGNASENDLYVEIGTASKEFLNYFRFDKTYIQLSLEKGIRRRLESREIDIREFYYMPHTVRVYNISEDSTNAALKHSSAIIDACLFELSYLKQIPVRLADEWPIREKRLKGNKQFEYGDSIEGNKLPLPIANFNPDIISFYQLGMSSDVPVLQFLAFYQVLEFFFIRVSDEQLYNKLAYQLKEPKFKTTNRHLDRLINDVTNHKRSTDETEMLKNVLNKFVDETELMDFINSYEKHIEYNLYTKKRVRFGEEIEVKLEKSHVIGNVAKIIKTIRNALVHSSDSYERNPRHVPFSKSTEIVKREIPLIKFLAERVIITSAT